MTTCVFAFGESLEPAGRLARTLGVPLQAVATRRFPDGESLVQVPAAADVALLYRSLDKPNDKLFELLLAASALRDLGARRIVLVAPYLAYMRQDKAFARGEAVSQRVLGGLIADHFDGLVTIDPHLHRVHRLEDVVPGIPVRAISAAPLLAEALSSADNPLLVGPDGESRSWVEAVAAPRRLEVLIGTKERRGDRDVSLGLPGIDRVAGRRCVLIDDVISSGTTLIECARLLVAAGARPVDAMVTHCLAGPSVVTDLRSAGIADLVATDAVPSAVSRIHIDQLLAQALGAPEFLGR